MSDSRTDNLVERLPLRAEALMKILLRYRGRNAYCWPSHKILGAELGVAGRTVRFWLRFLADAGQIEIEKTGRTNRYWIPPRPERESTIAAEIGHSERQKSATQSGRNRPLRAAEIGHSERQVSAYMVVAPLDELDSAAASASAAAAAAVESLEGENALQALEEIGMPASVRDLAESSASHATAVLAHCRFRFAERSLEPVKNRAGYIVACFRDPERMGFTQDDDLEWHPPAGQPRRAKPGEEKVHPREAEWFRNIREFDDLPMDDQKRIEAFVRERAPLFAEASSGHSGFRMECIACMVQWRKDGRLPVKLEKTK